VVEEEAPEFVASVASLVMVLALRLVVSVASLVMVLALRLVVSVAFLVLVLPEVLLAASVYYPMGHHLVGQCFCEPGVQSKTIFCQTD